MAIGDQMNLYPAKHKTVPRGRRKRRKKTEGEKEIQDSECLW
jgi:hypothetical protein